MQYYSKIRSYVVNKIYNKVRFIRYPTTYFKITTQNLKFVKKISEKINYREKKLRSVLPDLKTFNQFDLQKLRENGYLVLKRDRLNEINNFEETYKQLKKRFEFSIRNNDFTKGPLFKVLKLINRNVEEINRFANFFFTSRISLFKFVTCSQFSKLLVL